jgi:hypothetical protein
MKPFSVPLVLLALCSPCAQAKESLPPAPFQVESIMRPIAARSVAPDQPLKLIAIDLGTAEAGAKPVFTEPGAGMTVLYERGASPAYVAELRKSCAFACTFEEGETCHWQAWLAPQADARLLGEPLLAMPAEHKIERYERLTPQPAGALSWSAEYSALAWPVEDAGKFRIEEWTPAEGQLRASLRRADGSVQPIQDHLCSASEAAGLVALACPSLSVLAAGGVPLLVSWTDYHPAAALPVARMIIAGREAVLVRVSTKIDILHGRLVREGERWVPLFRELDYPTIC